MNKLSGDIYDEFVWWTFKKLGIYIGMFMTPSWRTDTTDFPCCVIAPCEAKGALGVNCSAYK